ncbi:MAG: endolytic transglycosylase MltG [Nitritalea sp.]
MFEDKKIRWYLIIIITFSVLTISLTFYFYQAFFSPNSLIDKDSPVFVEIYPETDFQELAKNLYEKEIIHDLLTFSFVAKLMNYQEAVRSGRYEIRPRMSNVQLVRLLRSGAQTPVRLTFTAVRTKEDLAEKLATPLFFEKEDMMRLLEDDAYIAKFGVDSSTVVSLFIPNTYEVYWNTRPETLFDRMYQEYKRFWNENRTAKAAALDLSPLEVSTLAAIVQAETVKADERPRVAGVYLNRLRIGMPLQADPTLVFASGDFSLRRVLQVHKEIDSPYNTYKYAGLPPGPINVPEISAIEAVLNPESHDYLYFCAKDDFSGYHAFAKTLNEHLVNARRYQAALNRAKIYQ